MNSDVTIFDFVKRLPIQKEDTVFVSSDLFKIALSCRQNKIDFSAKILIDAFLKHLSEGTLVIPAYTDHLKSGDCFDIKNSKPNTGALSMAAFKHPEFIRTSDPFHSFLVAGKNKELFASLNNTSTFGHNSGFALMHQLNAKAVFIDIPLQECFTFVHYCEEQNKIGYRKFKNHKIEYINNIGEQKIIHHQFFTRKRGYINHLNPLEKRMDDKQILQTTPWLNSIIKVANYQTMYDFISDDIINNKARNIHSFSIEEYIKLIVKSVLFRK